MKFVVCFSRVQSGWTRDAERVSDPNSLTFRKEPMKGPSLFPLDFFDPSSMGACIRVRREWVSLAGGVRFDRVHHSRRRLGGISGKRLASR